MNGEIKQEWVDALRSENYEQDTGSLRTKGDLFCCLGVLCDIVDRSGWHSAMESWRYAWDGDTALLPERVHVVSGLSHVEAEILMGMNDNRASFKEIADYIEKNL